MTSLKEVMEEIVDVDNRMRLLLNRDQYARLAEMLHAQDQLSKYLELRDSALRKIQRIISGEEKEYEYE